MNFVEDSDKTDSLCATVCNDPIIESFCFEGNATLDLLDKACVEITEMLQPQEVVNEMDNIFLCQEEIMNQSLALVKQGYSYR